MAQNTNTKTALKFLSVAVVMLGASFAAVPLYNWFCKVTGFAGVPQVAATDSETVLNREMTVRFDGSLDSNMPWEFKPAERTMTLKIGDTGLAFYEAYNPTDEVVAGTASFNVYPFSAGGYFTKIDCFCFEMQVLQPGERVMMPVTFYVDPEIVDDIEAKHVNSITLSYTFHVTDLPSDQASLATGTSSTVNRAQ